MIISPIGLTAPGITHHLVALNGTELHYTAAGDEGSPILLIHGFPETWWTFHKVIPLLAKRHRVFAVDLRGFGDSSTASDAYDSIASAEDLHLLIKHLDVGPVHISGQDIAGATVFRLASSHPEDIASLTAIEMGLPGFGMEALADITHGGVWYIGLLAAPGVPEVLLSGRERDFIGDFVLRAMCATPTAIADSDISEFVRTYSRADGWHGAIGLYRSMLREGAEIKAIRESKALAVPVLAVGAGGGAFTAATISQIASTEVRSMLLENVGHYVALEAPSELANAILDFIESVDAI